MRRQRPRRRALAFFVLAAAIVTLGRYGVDTTAAQAALRTPSWSITASSTSPTNFRPGDSTGTPTYTIQATNIGAQATDGSAITITDTLPPGLTLNPTPERGFSNFEVLTDAGGANGHFRVEASCETGSLIRCVVTGVLHNGEPEPIVVEPGERLMMIVPVNVSPDASGTVTNRVSVSGGGAAGAAASAQTSVTAAPATFGFQSFGYALTAVDGGAETQAGSHPYEMRVSFQLNTNVAGSVVAPAETPREITADLPAGFVVNPGATPVRCTETQLESDPPQCPDAAAVGIVHPTIGISGSASPEITDPIYNMVPPPGVPASFGFNAAELGIFVHLLGGVRSGGDYGLTAITKDIPEYAQISGFSIDLWGDPSDPSHDFRRGRCAIASNFGESCPAALTPTPLLTMPSACSGPLTATISSASWQHPDSEVSTHAESETSGGDPVGVSGCGRLDFTPSIKVQPGTEAADSATGLHVNLALPQSSAQNTLASANLKDAVFMLPKGLVVNPSAADGLGACSPAQVGLTSSPGVTPVTFTADPAHCPNASKIGSVKIETPLLDHPLPGAVYLATQGENPFHSLLALYLAVYDPISGVVVKLPGRVEPDPATGLLTATFAENPQLPFEDLEVEFFGGPRSTLTTPPTCGTYTTTTDLTPWTSPAGADAHPSDSFQIGSGPNGGACAGSESQMPNSPSFEAGTTTPLGGAYSPFVLKVSREDGYQRLRAINAVLPQGLTGRLAGIPYCSDAQIAAAEARRDPGEGALEQASPSCPKASEVGTVTVGAGSGAPLYVQGHAYLAGPYKGAPISLAIITPAVAGPFDLGDVVVRSALYVNPETAQITVRSDPIPTILQGIPLDVRSITVKMDRPGFTLNPTNCEAMAVTGEAISTTGNVAMLHNRFQVGGCKGLEFKPDLRLRLKGATKRVGHPALKAVVTYPKGGEYANIARAQVNLPHGEFLDQGNLNKTCTRPVLFAGNCPKTSVYGHAKAWTPLLEKPLQGPVYLVGGYGYKLPALVAELNGQIRILLKGKVDSGPNKGIRNTFEVVPDAPVSRFELSMKGGKKYGLLENSENLCKAPKAKRRAIVRFTGQNGAIDQFKPVVANSCKKPRKRRHATHSGSAAGAKGGN
jgi:uncharacterized repeat protein (TIGR01451 family)